MGLIEDFAAKAGTARARQDDLDTRIGALDKAA